MEAFVSSIPADISSVVAETSFKLEFNSVSCLVVLFKELSNVAAVSVIVCIILINSVFN